MNDLTEVFVYPDDENYESPPEWKSDDYEERYTMLCSVCKEDLHVYYAEPFASCMCGTMEWYK